MYKITMAGQPGGQLRQIQNQWQQKLNGLIPTGTKSAGVMDTFTKVGSTTYSSVQENSPGDESRLEIIRHKLLLGCELGEDDLKYLKDKSPELYDEYMASEDMRKQEEKAYQRSLRLCSTKEDVNRLKNMSLSRCAARIDHIVKNSDLSKDQIAIRVGAERRKMNDIHRNSSEFMRSSKYFALPSEKKAAPYNYASSVFNALQMYAELASADAEDRLEQLAKERHSCDLRDTKRGE